jgi:hypothetical protein
MWNTEISFSGTFLLFGISSIPVWMDRGKSEFAEKRRNLWGVSIMKKTFIEMKLFQVKPDRLEQFEAKIEEMSANQRKCEGCISLKYFKRFYTIDGIELGEPPRELTKIVKCVKYYSYWEFDTKENYGKAIRIYFDNYNKDLQKLLIAPFDINLGYSV